MSEKKLFHHTVWLDEELHSYLTRLEFREQAKTGEGVGKSRILRSIVRFHRDRNLLD